MAILKIARMGHPVLGRRAEEIADPTAPDVHALARDMVETLDDIQGAGLAAPQVHVSRRLVIFHVPRSRTEAPEDAVPLTVLVNPIIEPIGDAMIESWEGCLSVPGLTGLVPRHETIRYTAVALDGTPIDRTVSGFHAIVVQHECDHLDGILYPQRMTDMRKLIFADEMRHYVHDDGEEADE